MVPWPHPITRSIVLCALVAVCPARADTHLDGQLSFRGDELPLRLEIALDANGPPRVWLDVPDLLMAREPVTAEAVAEGIRVEFPFGIGAFTFDPQQPPTRIVRELGDEPMVLELAPGVAPPYAREPMRFQGGDLTFEGVLYRPAGAGPHPAIALLHGSAVNGLDDWAYRSWADWLARRGFAVLAWNKRRFADAVQARPANLEQLADDAVGAVKWLRSRDDVDARRIGLMGGSQGGWLSLAAASRDHDIAFLVLVSTAAVAPWRQQLQAVEWGMRDDGVDEADIDAALSYMGLYFHVVHTGRDWPALAEAAQTAAQRPWGEYVDQPRSLEDLAWWRANCCFQPAHAAARLDMPVLAYYGGRDWIVPPLENADRLPLLFPDGSRVEVHVLPGADHRLELPTGADARGRWRFPRMADGLFVTLEAWLQRNHFAP